jgi:hypothetical protein
MVASFLNRHFFSNLLLSAQKPPIGKFPIKDRKAFLLEYLCPIVSQQQQQQQQQQ